MPLKKKSHLGPYCNTTKEVTFADLSDLVGEIDLLLFHVCVLHSENNATIYISQELGPQTKLTPLQTMIGLQGVKRSISLESSFDTPILMDPHFKI